MSHWTTLATADELASGDRKAEFIDDEPVLLIRTETGYFCVADICSHDGQPLGDGPIADDQVTCTRHGARFDLATGEALCMPATERIDIYEVRVCDNDGQQVVQARHAGAAAPISDSNVDPIDTATDSAAIQPEATVDQETPTETDPASSKQGPTEGPTEGDDASRMLEALREVIDPELMINIVDLGLIYDIRQEDNQVVTVDMTLTSPACPAGPQLVQQSKMALERLDSVDEAQVNLVMTPPWTPNA
tara:strand:- start:576 stop:1319 length:744 start_codon:yes stop_codon:yes gene_type:complete